MTENEMLGRFEASSGNIHKILNYASAPLGDQYDQTYINLSEDKFRTISNAGQAVIAYCDFTKPFVADIDIHDNVDSQAGMQAIIKVPQFQEYLNFVGGNTISVEFYGQVDEENKASKAVIEGDLKAEIFLPSSNSDYESKQFRIVDTYNDDNEWVKPSNDEPLQTSFRTHAEEFNKIIDVVSFEDFALANYPVVVENGEFMLSASDKNDRDSVEGQLYSEDVDGPDVSNTYSRGFEELFSVISGELYVETEQDCPISVVRESNDGAMTLRYCILPAK